MSACGNYALLGTEGGRVERFNVQSGAHRGSYADARLGTDNAAHAGAVVGVHACAANRVAASVAVCAGEAGGAGVGGEVKVWAFRSRRLRALLPLPAAPVCTAWHASARLLAVACADLDVRVVDAAPHAPRVVRRFGGHADRPTALAFSADARLVVSAAMDATVRVWDVQASSCRDVMRLASPAVAVALSPNGAAMATAHSEQRAVYLWANSEVYGGGEGAGARTRRRVAMPEVGAGADDGEEGGDDAAGESGWARTDGVALDSDDEALGLAGDPGSDSDGVEVDGADDEDALDGRAILDAAEAELGGASAGEGAGPEPLEGGAVTLGMLAKAKWQGLVRLDEIRARSKPAEAVSKPESAPFFLPGLGDLEKATSGNAAGGVDAAVSFFGVGGEADQNGDGDKEDEDGGDAAPANKRVRRVAPGVEGAGALRLAALARAHEADGGEALEELRALSPGELDSAIAELEVVGDDAATREALSTVLAMLRRETERGGNFELVQALLARLLATHAEVLGSRADLREACGELHGATASAWGRVGELMDGVLCMAGFFTTS